MRIGDECEEQEQRTRDEKEDTTDFMSVVADRIECQLVGQKLKNHRYEIGGHRSL